MAVKTVEIDWLQKVYLQQISLSIVSFHSSYTQGTFWLPSHCTQTVVSRYLTWRPRNVMCITSTHLPTLEAKVYPSHYTATRNNLYVIAIAILAGCWRTCDILIAIWNTVEVLEIWAVHNHFVISECAAHILFQYNLCIYDYYSGMLTLSCLKSSSVMSRMQSQVPCGISLPYFLTSRWTESATSYATMTEWLCNA